MSPSIFPFAALVTVLSLFTKTALTDDQANFTAADFDALDITRLDEMVEDARSKFNNVDENDLFINNPSVGDYFDNISTAAGFLNVALKVYPKGIPISTYSLVPKYKAINYAADNIFEGTSSKTDEQPAPLGLRECRLLPEPLRNFTTLEALMGENCSKYVDRNGSAVEDLQEDMMQYARENNFEFLDDENRCLHVFVARHTKSVEAVAMFKMSFDKYYLAAVTVQAFCAVFAPKSSKEALRAKVVATHSSLARSLPRMDAVQLNDTRPWQCDTQPDKLIAGVRASREEIMSKVQSNASLLEKLTPEEYVNMTFEMVDALRRVDKESFVWLQNASTGPRDAEVRKRTRMAVIDWTADLMNNLEGIQGHLPMPFGLKEDVLWPESVGDEYVWPSKTVRDMLQNLASAFKLAKKRVGEDKKDRTDGGLARLSCEDFDLRRAAKPLMGGCEMHVDNDTDDNAQWLGERMMEYAMAHGFEGCEDNKCLPLFIDRYANHAGDDVGKLKITVGKYARILGIIQSICALFPLKDQVSKDDMRLKMVDVVRSLKEIMGRLSNVSSEAAHYKPCAADFPAWTAEVEQVATYVFNAATGSLNASLWEDRQRLHELVANDTVKRLNDFKYRHGYYFKALAYLPFADDGQHAFVRLPVGAEDVLRNESKSVKYVVSRFPKRADQALIRVKWNAIEKTGNEILDATFSTKASNLSKRIEEVENRFKTDIDGAFLSAGGFRALVALRCGNEFVWYELGYRYFPAGFATGDYVLATKQGNKFKSNCGQIVFFP